MLAPGVIIPFDGNEVDIPDGFERESGLDDKFPKAWGSESPNTSGGSATHTHTSPAHTHNISSHTHSIQTSSNNHTSGNEGTGSQIDGMRRGTHSHSGTITTQANVNVQSVAVTYSAQSNAPPFYEVIFIKSIGQNHVPKDVIVLSDRNEHLDFHRCDGNNGTPDLRNRYLKGADSDDDAGDMAGSNQNYHSITHTHTCAHGHTGITGNPSPSGTQVDDDDAGADHGLGTHQHPITLNVSTPTSSSNSDIGPQSEIVEPAYKKLLAYKNQNETPKALQIGMIAMWLGDAGEIPAGWVLCDGNNGTPDLRDKFIKIAANASEVGNTGGSNTHTHAAQSHTHTVPSHNHTGSVSAPAGQRRRDGSTSQVYWTTQSNPHTLTSVGNNNANLESSTTTANSASNEPEYVTVVYIQFLHPGGAGNLLTHFL